MRKIEVAFSTLLFDLFDKKDKIIIVTDILRASSAICTAFQNGVKEIIPVATVEEAREYKNQGHLIACERDGLVLDFADFGNSPFNFTPEKVKDKSIVYSTTNGTQAVQKAFPQAHKVIIASFVNFHFINNWLSKQDKDILILCAGWKGKFCLEDSVHAGAIADFLLQTNHFTTDCDATKAAVDLWKMAKTDLLTYVNKAAQKSRLAANDLDDVIPYCVKLGNATVLPVFDGEKIVDEAI
jgi:2-phosphosulfolactate phosphatase